MEVDRVHVIVNGKPVVVAAGASVDDLVRVMGLGGKWVIVEHNGEPVERAARATTMLATGDRVELVRATAGG